MIIILIYIEPQDSTKNKIFFSSSSLSTDCIQKKWYSQKKNILDMIFVQNFCVFGIILKQIDCSFCCFLNHIICFCKSRVMLCFVRQGKIAFVPLFIFSEEIVMEVSTTKKLICEDNMILIT